MHPNTIHYPRFAVIFHAMPSTNTGDHYRIWSETESEADALVACNWVATMRPHPGVTFAYVYDRHAHARIYRQDVQL